MLKDYDIDRDIKEIIKLNRDLKDLRSEKISSVANVSLSTVNTYRNGHIKGDEFNKNRYGLTQAQSKTVRKILSAMRRINAIRISKRKLA
jgi:hypothetical protein